MRGSMNTDEVYREYCAINAHMSTATYDYFKYGGKIKSKDITTRGDKHMFHRLSLALSSSQVPDYFVANAIAGNKWIGGMNKDVWLAWTARMARLPELLVQDLDTILKTHTIPKALKLRKNEHPVIFQLLMGGHISIETFIILDRYIKFKKEYDKVMEKDVVWKPWSLRIAKYSPFLYKKMNDYSHIDFGNLLSGKLLEPA